MSDMFGKPYMGVRLDLQINAGLIHGLTRDEFIALLTMRGEPFLFSCGGFNVPVGVGATFFDGTQATVVRAVTRQEFLNWEQRLFPGCKTMLVEADEYFVEVRPD